MDISVLIGIKTLKFSHEQLLLWKIGIHGAEVLDFVLEWRFTRIFVPHVNHSLHIFRSRRSLTKSY